MAHHKLTLKPFPVPTEAVMEMPVGLKQDGLSRLPTVKVEDLDRDAVDELAEQWLKALYASRKQKSPFSNENNNNNIAMPYDSPKGGR